MIKALLKRSGFILLVLLLVGVFCVSCSDDDDDDDKGGGVKETVADKEMEQKAGIDENTKIIKRYEDKYFSGNGEESDVDLCILDFYDNGEWVYWYVTKDFSFDIDNDYFKKYDIDLDNKNTFDKMRLEYKGTYEGNVKKNNSEVILTYKYEANYDDLIECKEPFKKKTVKIEDGKIDLFSLDD